MTDSVLREQVLESLEVVLLKVLSLNADISENTRLMEDLGMTSVSTMEVILELEDALEIQIDVEEIKPANLASVGTLADYVTGYVVMAD